MSSSILAIGPELKVVAQATASLAANANAELDFGLSVSGAKIAFPLSSSSGGKWTPADSSKSCSSFVSAHFA